jgi:hypothetical protein
MAATEDKQYGMWVVVGGLRLFRAASGVGSCSWQERLEG